jgi:RNA polymerase sigma-70 factor (ECF subfamily)
MRDLEAIREMSWVVRARAGDRDAFMALVGTYERRLLYFIRRFERDPNRALDVLQDVWLTAWRTLGSLRKPAAFRAWLYRIAHGKIVTAIRSEQRRREVEGLRNIMPPLAAVPADEVVDTADLLHYVLQQLSPEHRTVVTLRFLEDMSILEIADVTECPAGTVKSRLHYAKRFMQAAVEEQYDGKQS